MRAPVRSPLYLISQYHYSLSGGLSSGPAQNVDLQPHGNSHLHRTCFKLSDTCNDIWLHIMNCTRFQYIQACVSYITRYNHKWLCTLHKWYNYGWSYIYHYMIVTHFPQALLLMFRFKQKGPRGTQPSPRGASPWCSRFTETESGRFHTTTRRGPAEKGAALLNGAAYCGPSYQRSMVSHHYAPKVINQSSKLRIVYLITKYQCLSDWWGQPPRKIWVNQPTIQKKWKIRNVENHSRAF